MLNFEYHSPTKFFFGKDTLKDVGKILKSYAPTKVLLHYGGSSIKKFGTYDKVVIALKENNIDFIELSGVVPNPELSLVNKGIDLCKNEGVDFILAVGGGSVIDSAKAIGSALAHPEVKDVWDFFATSLAPTKMIPLGCIVTLPAAGSESSNSCVITNSDLTLKKGMRSEAIRPTFAILDPTLTYTLPPYQSACGVVDMLAHIIERYFTQTKNVDVTDRMCEAVMATIFKYGEIILKDPTDYEARAQIMWCGTLAHNNILGVDREQDWASHKLGAEMTALYGTAHGASLAIIIPIWMRHVYKANPDKFLQFASNVMKIDVDFDNKERCIIDAIDKLEAYFSKLGMPVRMSEADIPNPDIELMSKKVPVASDGTQGFFYKMSYNDFHEIFTAAK